MKEKTCKTAKIVLIILICLTLAFIWGNSMLNRVQSTNSSSNVLQFVKPIFDPIFHLLGFSAGVSELFIRKLGHFSEFFLLGAELSLLIILCKRVDLHFLGHALAAGLAVAVTDESIQLLSKRGSAVSDVLLDFTGFALAVIVILAVFQLVNRRNIRLRTAKNLDQ